MISVSSDFKNAMRQPVKTLQMYVKTNETTPQTFDSGDVLASVEIEASGYFFATATKALTMKLIGTTYNLIDVGLTPTLRVQISTLNGNPVYADLDYGIYKVTEQTIDLEKGITTIKGYDMSGIMALQEYKTGDMEWPCTVKSLVEQIANKFGLTIVTDLTTLANYDYEIQEDLYANIANTNYRNILSEIAGATGTICRISGTNIEFLTPQISGSRETLSYDNLIKVKLEPKYGPINAVVLSRTPQEDNIAIRDETSIAANGLTELKLANNEILDDDRETLASPILNVADGFSFYPFEATTEGHGWYECGDRISFTDGANSWEAVVTYYKLTFSGGIKEVIKGVAPTDTQTDYARAGGIVRTIYNTEIKVDKQNREIESVVKEVQELGDEVSENYTQIVQNLNSITASIQNTGGSNLLYNSVGYATDTSRVPTIWSIVGTVTAYTSPESLTYGAKSGNQINISASSSISQTITTAAGEPISLSARVKKGIVGSVTITIAAEGGNSENITLADQTSYLWRSVSIPNFIPTSSTVTVTISASSTITEFAITDLMLITGDHTSIWQQASGEILSSNVLVNNDGVVIKNNVYAGDYVQITPLEFAGYSAVSGSTQKVFSLNRDTTQVVKLAATTQITMPPIKIVPIASGSRAGWAFVKESS